MRGFVLNRADGSSQAVRGYRYSAPPGDSKKYQAASQCVPGKVDLRPWLTAVENQGDTMSCVANAVAGAYEYLAKMHTGNDVDVSRLFVYYNARRLEVEADTPIEDDGACIRSAIESLKLYGACAEVTYPFDEKRVNEVPPPPVYAEAAQFLVEDMRLVPTELAAWKSCLAQGLPIIFGLNLYQSFERQRKKGMVPMPSAREAARASHGSHAMLAVGYSDPDRVFIVRNSWGADWGDRGYCYIPYDYLLNSEFNDGDSWVIHQLTPFEFQGGAGNDEASVLGHYESELAHMGDGAYAALLEAMGEHPLEYRIALLFLHAAQADAELSEAEYEAIARYMTQTLTALGVDMSAKKILRHARQHVHDAELIQTSVALLGAHLSKAMLARIVADLAAVVGVDGLSAGEADFLHHLVAPWQLPASGDGHETPEETLTLEAVAQVNAQLARWASETDQAQNWPTSVIDLLKLLKLPHTAAARRTLATSLGCPPRSMADLAQMDAWLHPALLRGLATHHAQVPETWRV